MPNLPDTDLDELLKQAYEKYDMGKQTNSWESLSSVLDEHLPQKKDKRRGFFFLLYLFLMVGGSSLLIFTGNKPDRRSLATDTSKFSGSYTDGRRADGAPAGAGGVVSGGDAGKVRDAGEMRAARKVRDAAGGQAAGERVASGSARRDAEGSGDDRGGSAGGAARPTTPALSRATASPAPADVSAPLATVTGPVPPIVAKNLPAQDSALANIKKKKDQSPSKTRFFEAGILAGEDESNVRFKTNSRAGFNLGLLLGYSFSKRWSVTSGLIYTWKNYMADGKDYHAPKDHFVNSPGVVLQQAASTCSMLDIPINVRFNLSVKDRSKLFLTTGISSYVMLREVYTFYGTDSGTAFKRGLDGDEVLKKGFWFSILNLSIGYEKNISKRLSFQAEPYVKIPLQGIGFGKVQMNSYGINFALKMKYFHPNRK